MEHDSALGQPVTPPDDRRPGIELRHLRYLVAVAEAGTFTQAAERMRLAQPTLSQQVRRLEQMVGTPLLSRQRDGVRLTAAGSVLLKESRTVLSMVDHGLRRSRQAAGLDRLRLRFVVPPHLPESLAAHTVARLRSVARWPRFAFIDPPSRHSLALALAFAATASRPTAALSSPVRAAGDEVTRDVWQQAGDAYDMVRVRLGGHSLTATAAVVWSRDLPRHLQQVLFDTADAGVAPECDG